MGGEARSKCVRILIADDEERIRTVLARILTDAGHRVDSVGRGDEALQQLVSGNYELAILDAQMPALGAIEIATRCQASAAHSIPIIVLTADASSDTNAKCTAVGVHRVLTKPVRSQGLLDAINQVITGVNNSLIQNVTHLPPTTAIDQQIISELTRLYPEPQVMKDMLRQFIGRMKEITVQVEKALNDQRLAEVYQLLHRLEGVAGSMGALAVQNRCREQRKVKNLEKMNGLIDKLNYAIDEVALALKSNYDMDAR